jgi:cystathionine beta-synthase
VHPADTVREAIDRMTETGVSQLVVLSAEPPVVLGEVLGALHEEVLLDLVFSGKAKLTDEVSTVVGEPLALIGVNEPVATAR